jgi:hypothetical protein
MAFNTDDWTVSLQMMIDEKQYYDYNTNSASPAGEVIGHYTQVAI